LDHVILETLTVGASRTNGDRPATPSAGRARINLERSAILLIDNPIGLDVLSHIFYGFGARTLHRCRTVAEAKKIVETSTLDLIVIEALLGEEDAYDFVRSIRWQSEFQDNWFTPIIVLSAHTAKNMVAKARDCGANFFVAKPVSPNVMMDRLQWVAREKRQFLQSDGYSGPDRRFHEDDPAKGGAARRREDLYIDTKAVGENA
jgi:DNA-binding response OmpR family regulator